MAAIYRPGDVQVTFSKAEAEALMSGDRFTAQGTVARQKLERALRLAGPTYYVHEGEQAYTVIAAATNDAAATILKRHFNRAADVAADLCAVLNEQEPF